MENKYIIVGKAASGKDYLLNRMTERGYVRMKQYTTRPVRENETGTEYHFITDRKFQSMIGKGKFVSGHFYAIGWYGISLDELLKSDVSILSPANMKDIFSKFPELRKMFTVIYLDTPLEIRRERLSKRYDGRVDDDNERRIKSDESDFRDFKDFDIKLTDTKEVSVFINNLLTLN